jgi:hypothetical protein
VLVVCLAALVTVGVHTTVASHTAARTQERATERLLDCLSARAHRLVTPDERVHAQGSDLEAILDLEGSLAPWATMVIGLAPASATLDLRPAPGAPGPETCGGYALTLVPTRNP